MWIEMESHEHEFKLLLSATNVGQSSRTNFNLMCNSWYQLELLLLQVNFSVHLSVVDFGVPWESCGPF